MRAQVMCALALMGVALPGGCRTRQDSLDECLQDRIRLTERLADVLEDVTEDSSAEEIRSRLEALLKEQTAIEKRERKLKKEVLTGATMKRLATKEREGLAVSLARLEKAREQAMRNTEVAGILQGLPLPRLPRQTAPEGD